MDRLKFPCHVQLAVVVVVIFITPSFQQCGQQPNNKVHTHCSSASNVDFNNEFITSVITPTTAMSVPYFRASIPMRIYECLRDFSTLRCTKLYVLQKMEESKQWPNTGNITKDFLNQFFGEDEQIGSLISDRFKKMSDKDLNKRLVLYFQRFFKNRDIKLRFLPRLTVKIVPNKENKVKFSLKKKANHRLGHQGRSNKSGIKSILMDSGFVDSSIEDQENAKLDEDGIDIKSKHKDSKKRKKHKKGKHTYKTTVLQMAVPVMIMPAILMGTFLPFILPVLKMATLTSMIMNNTAFMAALIYAARTHINAQDEQQINYGYGHTGYH